MQTTCPTVTQLTQQQSDDGFMQNRGLWYEDNIYLGVFDDPMWKLCVLYHELGHYYRNSHDERKAWLWALERLPIKVSFKHKRKMVKCFRR